MILLCYHCGNQAPHQTELELKSDQLFEIDDRVTPEERYLEPFHYQVLTCGTCGGLAVLGDFWIYLKDLKEQGRPWPRLYPLGPDILPPSHTLASDSPAVPGRAIEMYRKAWPLRHTHPAAFANQVRRVLEVICGDQEAAGGTLAQKLEDLAKKGVLPSDLADTAALVREVGNEGSHATPRELNIYDAELLDELLKLIIQFIYLGPSHRVMLKRRLGFKRRAEKSEE